MPLLCLIFGFEWWWPIGLVLLLAFIASRGFGRWHSPQFAGGVPATGWDPARTRWENRMTDRAGSKRGCGPRWPEQTPSNNPAFDEYRAETLRRLEDEQREFKEFLERLRLAKDRAELDQFLKERSSRPRMERPQS